MVPPPPEAPCASAGVPAAETCTPPVHEPGSCPPAQQGPQISCGVGRCCDAEAAASDMLRRLVRSYEAALPPRRLCGVLRGFVEILQRFASVNAAETPQEQYPPAVRVVSRHGDKDVAVTVEPHFTAAVELWGHDLRAVVAGASAAVARVLATLVCSTLQILAALEQLQVRPPLGRPSPPPPLPHGTTRGPWGVAS